MSGRIDSNAGSKSSSSRGMRWALWSTLAVVAACGSAVTETQSVSGYTTGTGSGGSGGTGASTGTAGMAGLPCDVAALLTSKCISCHSNPPLVNVPEALVSYADLTAPSKGDPSISAAAMALSRMKSTTSPMPPAPASPPTAAEIAAFEAWVTAGTPMGTCGDVDAGPNPFDAPAQCTSMVTSTVIDGAAMKPGEACIACHVVKADPDQQLTIGGTAYATAHEPNDCNAQVETGPAMNTAVVEVTDKNGAVFSLKVDSVGNFSRKTILGPLATPYTAKIKYNGLERVMIAAQTTGDCNSCHTQTGTQNAPGRILLP
jgi:hypothetical protein